MTDRGLDLFEKKVFKYCTRYGLLDADVIITGLSGGPDSVCLITLLNKFAKTMDCTYDIVAVHVNHNLRPVDCDKDERFVRDLCLDMGIKLFSYSEDVEKAAKDLKISEEEAGRRIRYEHFRDVAASISPGRYVIATAHHLGDLAETMMMNLFRGTGLDGLCAMKPVDGDLIRPLLCVDKDEIEDYLQKNGIGYVTDRTNMEEIGTRNVWRNRIFPVIGENNARDPVEALASAHSLLSLDKDYIDSVADSSYGRYLKLLGEYRALDLEFCKLHDAVATRVIRRLWMDSFGNMTDLEAVNTGYALEFAGRSDTSGFVTLDMPFARTLWRFEGLMGFCNKEDIEPLTIRLAEGEGLIASPSEVNIPVKEGMCGKIPGTSLYITSNIVENIDNLSYNNHSWICPLDLPGLKGRPLAVRNGCGDSKFTKAGALGGKLLKDVFADRKVPRPARGYVLAVTSEDTALWVPGIGHAAGFTDDLSRARFLEEGYEGRYLVVRISQED